VEGEIPVHLRAEQEGREDEASGGRRGA
jgi:hypothetical protein